MKDDCTLERRQKNQKQGNLYHNCQKVMQSLCEHSLWHSLLSGQERSLQYCHGPQATNVPNVALYSKPLTKKGQQLWFTESLGAIILCFNEINDNSFSTRERTEREEKQQKWKIKLVLFHFLSTLLAGLKSKISFQIPLSAWNHSSKWKVLITCSSYTQPM